MGHRVAAVLATVLSLVAVPGAAAQDEGTNTAKSEERAREHQAPEYQSLLQARSVSNAAEAAQIQTGDPERAFAADACWHLALACAGDVRLYDFQTAGHGLVEPVIFTARNGSTISGHVWATKTGPAKRPAIVITNGSIQASEQMYWWAAQTLAKGGYVVVTSDPQGQGRSDNLGEGADSGEGAHSQVAGNTFYDGTQDALDFLLSSAGAPYCPRPSRGGTSHCDKQKRRVTEGRNAAANPFGQLVDPERIGIAGHSYGASGVSWIGQQDPRVDAVVAWDSLCDPSAPDLLPSADVECTGGGTGGPVPLRVPALNLTSDYTSGREAKTTTPDPLEKSQASLAYSKAGIDTGSIAIRGGTHFEFSYLPSTSFRATLRGVDLSAWYTLAWFDKYVKGGDRTADDRLLSPRWRTDPADAVNDPAGGGNLFSYHYRSRLDVHRADGSRVVCEDLRTGCSAQNAGDHEARLWSFLSIATSPDGASAYAPIGAVATPPVSCRRRRAVTLRAVRVRGLRGATVLATAGGRRVGRARGRRVRVDLTRIASARTRVRVTLRVTGRRAGRTVTVTQRRLVRLCV